MLKWHQLLKVDGERTEEDGIAKGTHESWCVESLDIKLLSPL